MNISDYKIIGNLKTAALVASGSIDWLCKPDFDSPSIFTRILDEEAGSFSVISDEDYQVSSEYLQDTAIVQTKYAKEGKSFILKDFMIPEFDIEPDVLVRKIKGLKGKNNVNMVFNPRPDYGKTSPKFEIKKNKIVLKNAHANISLLVPKGEIIHTDKGLEINFVIQENESLEFILKISDEYFDSSSHDLEKETVNYWKKWLDKGKFFDFCEDRLKRTAITLKLMQYSPTGAIIAAPTTSLPEEIGGERNWDYRYTWVRDATFTLYGLYVLDYIEEAEAYFSFIENIVEFDDEGYADFKLMYTVEGKNIPDEETLDHLAGYKNSKPVRIGNEAGDQFQLDLYGSIIDAYYFMEEKGLEISENGKKIIKGLVKTIQNKWLNPDNGIWEIRRSPKHYTYSKVMAWVGVNRAIELGEKLGISDEIKSDWSKLEKEIEEWIWDNCYDKKRELFLQYPESKAVDATNFLFVLIKFLDKHDPRTRVILDNTLEILSKDSDLFVHRYNAEDGLEGSEGAFILCTFWMISAYAILEDVELAQKYFKQFESITKPLLSEEIDSKSYEYLGNFPQAFSHLGYAMAANYINKYSNNEK